MLVPLSDSHIGELLGELLGTDTSVGGLSLVVADRVAGIPSAPRRSCGISLRGARSKVIRAPMSVAREVGDVQVPPTLQAAIGARIDRLTPSAKRTLNAAAVIGARFRADLLERLLGSMDLSPLLDAELIDQVGIRRRCRVRLPPSANSEGCIRVATDVDPLGTAPARGGDHAAGAGRAPAKEPPSSRPSTNPLVTFRRI